MVILGVLLLLVGVALVLWGADRFTDGAIRVATLFALSPFYVGTVVSGLEPENLVTGVAAALGDLPQVALGTVIGSGVFMLTGGLGLSLLLVPMEVRVPRAAGLAMVASIGSFALFLWDDGVVGRVEGAVLVVVAVGLMAWLYRRSPAFVRSDDEDDDADAPSRARALILLLAGVGALVLGAELLVQGVRALIATLRLSETFLGMAVIGLGESLEETARMVAPARRGHPELAWGNVVGTIVVLVAFNLGIIALARPLAVDPLVLRLHAPYLVGSTLVVAGALFWARRLGRAMGGLLFGLYVLYLALNVPHMWQ